MPRLQTDQMLATAVEAVNNGLAEWWYAHRDVPRESVEATARRLLWPGLALLADLANDPVEDSAGGRAEQ